MLPCDVGDEVHTQYEEFMALLDDLIRDLYDKWNHSLDVNMNVRLDRPLIVRSHTRPGLLEPNFDR
jgi:hypothetical protein